MKKRILLCIFLLIGFRGFSQQNNQSASADFASYSSATQQQASAAYKAKDYKQAVKLCGDVLARYNALTPELKSNFIYALRSTYYNYACYLALDGQKESAVSYFRKAVDAGYTNYANASTDSDLASLRDDPQFKVLLAKVREAGDYGYILKKSGPYIHEQNNDLPAFVYQPAAAPELVAFKEQFNLDSIGGNGDEISKLKNLLQWVHNTVRHDGSSSNPRSQNAADLIAVCKKENRGVNCRMLSTILKDAYQAEGFPARMVTCLPKDSADNDCHVITVVWAKSLNKWVWMDPTFNAYMSDEKGNLLNIEEVRQRLINDRPLVLNNNANWNNQNKETKEAYLNYMSKNLYWLQCSVKSEWDLETYKKGRPYAEYINLYPGNYTDRDLKKASRSATQHATNDPAYFWQKPVLNN